MYYLNILCISFFRGLEEVWNLWLVFLRLQSMPLWCSWAWSWASRSSLMGCSSPPRLSSGTWLASLTSSSILYCWVFGLLFSWYSNFSWHIQDLDLYVIFEALFPLIHEALKLLYHLFIFVSVICYPWWNLLYTFSWHPHSLHLVCIAESEVSCSLDIPSSLYNI